MNFSLTDGQNQALDAIERLHTRFPQGGGVLVINGWAGTGKTSLIRAIGDQAGNILVLAPTGKAAVRVKEAAFVRASTIHRWLYKASEDPSTGEVLFTRSSLLDIEHPNYHSIIVDESSMLSAEVWADLYEAALGLELNVILIGDEFQLPPVDDAKNFSVFDPNFEADERVNLTHVLRQAMESPILRAANAIREGINYTKELSTLPLVMRDNVIDACVDAWSNGEPIICHKNETRHFINEAIRVKSGRILAIEDREPLLIVKNNYTLNIFNGEIFEIKHVLNNLGGVSIKNKWMSTACYVEFSLVELMNGDECVIAHQQLAERTDKIGHKTLQSQAKKLLRVLNSKKTTFVHSNYGYVISAHRAQGSQFQSGLVLMESSIRFGTLSGRRWAYTALTRFVDSVKICWY